jgi:Na+/H+ antiporter NhaD/arsenite permease-like protein
MIFVAVILLVIYFFMDSYFFRKEGGNSLTDDTEKKPLRVDGMHNVLFLAGIIGAVLMSGVVHWGELSVLGVHLATADIVRDAILILMAALSLLTTRREIREDNEFTWFPMQEVAILFIGIFLTMMPCLKILQAGAKGELAFLIATVQEPFHYFWITGILSSFLDNAPTYLTFLSSLLGKFYSGMDAQEAIELLIQNNAIYLKALSTGAVFFGAVSYIGNAPNFMVRSIAEETGTPMPSFFGYMIKYSIPVLVSIFILLTFVFYF